MSDPNQPSMPLQLINTYKINLSKLKAKSFYMYHKCQLGCYSLPDNKQKQCLDDCKFELNEFYKLKQKSYPHVQEVFMGPSSVQPHLREEYADLCRETERELNKYVKNLDEILDKLIE